MQYLWKFSLALCLLGGIMCLTGCNDKPSDAELGTVVDDVSHLPGMDEPYPVPTPENAGHDDHDHEH